jgi:eukaryotic-like serine/threonine-protein kinase
VDNLRGPRAGSARLVDVTTEPAAPAAAASPPDVPGYELHDLLGRGASGEVWSGQAHGVLATPVAVKLVSHGPGAGRELAVLRAVRHPHVLALRDGIALDDGRLALVTDLLDGGTLGAVVAARGRLRAGEVVTVLVPLARALAALHAQGVQHGDLAPGNVLFTSEGRPVLADLGTTRVTGEPRREVYGTAGYVDPAVLAGAAPGPASDVYGLGALAWFSLTGAPPPSPPCRPPLAELVPGAPPALVSAVESAVDPQPGRRPAPLELARAVHAAVAAQPVWRRGGAPADGGLTHRVGEAPARPDRAPRHRRARNRPWPRRAFRTAFAVLAVLAGGSFAVPLLAHHGAGPAGTRLTSDVVAARVVRQLATERASALADPAGVRTAGAKPGSPAARADDAALARLRASRARYAGLRLTPTSVRVLRSRGGEASVLVELDASAYDVVIAGRVARHVPAAHAVRSRLDLELVAGRGWRVVRIRPA